MKRIALVLLLLCLPVIAFGQTSGKISGTVASDGQPLAGANVLVKGTTYGAATDEDGRYYILDVPVGTYEVEAQYIGYKKLAISNVHVNANLTTELNFNLEVAAVEGEEVEVTAERPLIQKNATNSTAIIDKEVVRALPVRTVGAMIGLQAGAVGTNVRGSRTSDNAYYIDGVLMRNHWTGGNLAASLSQQGMTEIAFQAGGFSAEYGGANGGVVNIATATGTEKVSGSFEYLSDLGSSSPGSKQNKLYSYGRNLYNFSVGAPITSNIRFFGLIEKEKNEDANPSYAAAPFMDREILTQAQFEAKGYDTLYTLQDGDYPPGVIYAEQFVFDNQTDPDSLTAGVAKYDTTYVLGSNYRRLYGKKRSGDDERFTYQGNVDMDFRPFRVKLGIGGYNYISHNYSHIRHLLSWDNYGYEYNSGNRYLYANTTWSLSSKSYLKAIASKNSYEQFFFNNLFDHGTKDDATKAKFDQYGKRSTDPNSPNYYLRRDGRNPLTVQDLVGFARYGTRYDDYEQRFQDQTGLRLDYVNQYGVHELKAGMEFYKTTIYRYRIAQPFEVTEKTSLLDVDHDGIVSLSEVGDQDGDGTAGTQADYDTWRFYTYRNAYVDNLGYDLYGKKTTSGKTGSEPGKAVESRFYFQDKIELKDVVVQVGLSYETFDAGTKAPAGKWDADNDKWVVTSEGTAEGFRNVWLDDTGWIDKTGTQKGSLPWKKVPKRTALMPRLGFSFPVTDQTVFRANYGVYWQAPPLQNVYLTDAGFTANLTQGNMTVSENPALKPERTTSYEVGISQQIGQYAALDIAGYYKESRDYLMLKNHEVIDGQHALKNGSNYTYAQYMNGDYGVTQGFSFSLSMRRMKGILGQVNYTYMNARGTGSGANDNFDIAWTGDTYPTTINRLSYDQTHTGSVILDYRNPMGFGVNAVYTFGSGHAYTPTTVQSEVFGRGWDIPTAAINSGDLPWVARLDLRADYNLKVAGVNLNLYLLVQNAFNRQNVTSVYRGSGQVANDAWLKTAEGQIWVHSQETEYPAVKGKAESLYLDRLSSPGRWGIPRIVRFGFQVNI
jgi:hypothetical protein